MDITLGKLKLADDAAGYGCGAFEIDASRQIQTAPVIEAAAQSNFDRANIAKVISFHIERTFADFVAAEIFAQDHTDVVLGLGPLTLTLRTRDADGGATGTRVYAGAMAQRCRPTQDGVTVRIAYTIRCGLAAKPA